MVNLYPYLRFLSAVACATLMCAFAFEAVFPGIITTQISLDFFFWIAILVAVTTRIFRSVVSMRT